MDGRVDIYALGVMGYEMLTGAPPFPGLNAQQTLAAHVTRAPVPVGQQRDGLSPALEAVVMRCLAKRPADRFQTADELVAALEPLAVAERRDHADADAAGGGARGEAAGKIPLDAAAVAGAALVAAGRGARRVEALGRAPAPARSTPTWSPCCRSAPPAPTRACSTCGRGWWT